MLQRNENVQLNKQNKKTYRQKTNHTRLYKCHKSNAETQIEAAFLRDIKPLKFRSVSQISTAVGCGALPLFMPNENKT